MSFGTKPPAKPSGYCAEYETNRCVEGSASNGFFSDIGCSHRGLLCLIDSSAVLLFVLDDLGAGPARLERYGPWRLLEHPARVLLPASPVTTGRTDAAAASAGLDLCRLGYGVMLTKRSVRDRALSSLISIFIPGISSSDAA
jgi:hypothetical protein